MKKTTAVAAASTGVTVNNHKIGSCNGRILRFSSANIKLLTCIKFFTAHLFLFLSHCSAERCRRRT